MGIADKRSQEEAWRISAAEAYCGQRMWGAVLHGAHSKVRSIDTLRPPVLLGAGDTGRGCLGSVGA